MVLHYYFLFCDVSLVCTIDMQIFTVEIIGIPISYVVTVAALSYTSISFIFFPESSRVKAVLYCHNKGFVTAKIDSV